MPVTPWTDASKALVSAVFGDPEKKAEFDKLDQQQHQFDLDYALKQRADARDEAYNPAKIRQAEASAAASSAEATDKGLTTKGRQEYYDRTIAGGVTPSESLEVNSPTIPQIAELIGKGPPLKAPSIPQNPATFAAMLEPSGPPAPQSLTEHLSNSAPPQVSVPGGPVDTDYSRYYSPQAISAGVLAGTIKPEEIAKMRMAGESINQTQGMTEPNRRMAVMSAGAGSPYSQDQTLAQALSSENSPAEISAVATGKLKGDKPNIAELLSHQITMGPPAPGQTVMPENASLGDRLMQAGMDANNIPLMNTARGMKQNEVMSDYRGEAMKNRQVQNYAKAADDYSAFVGSLTKFGDTIKKYPPGKNIPGFGSEALLPSVALSPEGQAVRQDFMAVANGIVYLMSGKQINEAEGKRFAQQLGGTIENGTFAIKQQFSDDRLRQGMENVTKQIQNKLKNTGAMLSPEALAEYKGRGGTATPDFLDSMVESFGQQDTNEPFPGYNTLSPEEQKRADELMGGQ